MKELALLVGVGRATGQALCRLWSRRYRMVLIARSNELIDALAGELPDTHALQCDVADRDAWRATLGRIREEFGAPRRILINTEAALWGDYAALPLDAFARSFDVNAVSLLQLVQVLFPDQDKIAAGTRIIISSSPAAYAPPARFLGLAPSRVAQRVLAELLHANLARHGLAFSVFSINGAIDEPKMRALYPREPTSFFIQPHDIASAIANVLDSEAFDIASEIRGASAFAG